MAEIEEMELRFTLPPPENPIIIGISIIIIIIIIITSTPSSINRMDRSNHLFLSLVHLKAIPDKMLFDERNIIQNWAFFETMLHVANDIIHTIGELGGVFLD